MIVSHIFVSDNLQAPLRALIVRQAKEAVARAVELERVKVSW